MSRPPFFPMMIDLSGKKVLVAGGGKIASRRTETLIRCGADVTAVSPEFCDDFPNVSRRISREFQPSDIDDEKLTLIIAATDNREVNHIIYSTAKSKSIPVNVADCQKECDFFFPSLINSGHVAASVSTAGLSSSLTRRLSDRLRKVWALWIEEENNTKNTLNA